MAYTTPPTFSNGAVLSAANLNTLSDDIEYLYALATAVSAPFCGQTMVAGGDSRYWTFRRRARYLHYQVRLTASDIDEFELLITNYGGTDQDGVIDHSNHSAPYTWSGYVDLDSLGDPPALLEFYKVHFVITFSGSGNELEIDYLLQSDSTTL